VYFEFGPFQSPVVAVRIFPTIVSPVIDGSVPTRGAIWPGAIPLPALALDVTTSKLTASDAQRRQRIPPLSAASARPLVRRR
jgi:hypothetical protein